MKVQGKKMSAASFILALGLIILGAVLFIHAITLNKAHDTAAIHWIEGWMAAWGAAILATLLGAMTRPDRGDSLDD